jgi:dynein heavy chain, axonemal
MPYTQEATIKTHYKRLKKYVKMADYFAFNSKVAMMTHSAEILSNSLEEFIKT